MNNHQVEVHRYYKASHPESLILYHLPGRYVVLGEDVETATKSISSLVSPEPEVGLMPDTASVLAKLGADGIATLVINYRNEQRELDLPEICRLQAEKEADY